MRNGGIEGYAALQSTANGNCLFNSVFIVLFGEESKAVELKIYISSNSFTCCLKQTCVRPKNINSIMH